MTRNEPRVADLADPVPLCRQGTALVGWKEAVQNSLELQVVEFNALVPNMPRRTRKNRVYDHASTITDCAIAVAQEIRAYVSKRRTSNRVKMAARIAAYNSHARPQIARYKRQLLHSAP